MSTFLTALRFPQMRSSIVAQTKTKPEKKLTIKDEAKIDRMTWLSCRSGVTFTSQTALQFRNAKLDIVTSSLQVWSDVHIQDSATVSSGWRKPFADPHYVPRWSAIPTE
jgi:hypothetical protein